jgi:hypothetical protein
MDLTRVSLLALLLAAPAGAQLSSSASVTLTVTVPTRLSIRSLATPTVMVRSSSEIDVVTSIEVESNTRYTVTARRARTAQARSSQVRVSVRNAAGALEELSATEPVTIVSNGARSARHELICRVYSVDPSLVQPNGCELVFEVTSVVDERLLRASAVLNLEEALLVAPRPSVSLASGGR